jgi:uncharacterized protein (DUF1800 family)
MKLAYMRRQNDIFRKYGLASFRELLPAVVKDPAMLIWLDATLNRAGNPNENLARELYELFSLGIGNYTERDVKEAARALTGWIVTPDGFQNLPSIHDEGEKTILGHTGKFNGDDLLGIVLDHPATAHRLAWRIGGLFLGDEGAGEPAVAELAKGLSEKRLDLHWAVATVLRSERFFAAENFGNRTLSPVEFVVGAVRALELSDPPPDTLILAEWTDRLGQKLFDPPNVGGWKGGAAWLTTRTLLGRANFALALVEGRLTDPPTPFDALGLARRYGFGPAAKDVADFYAQLLHGEPLAPAARERVLALLPAQAAAEVRARELVARLLAAPESQLS